MRKTNWLFLLSLGSGGVTLASVLAIWLSLQQRPPLPLNLPQHADADTYATLALELASEQRYADAAEANTRALSYTPDQPGLVYNQGWLAARLGRWHQALHFLDKARNLAPRDAEIRYTRAWVLGQLRRDKDMRAELAQAKALGWKPAGNYASARLLQLENQHKAALKLFDQVIRDKADQGPAFWYWRSQSERALHQDKAALADLDRAVASRPSARLYRERAALYEQLGQPAAALADLERSHQLEPSRDSRLARIRLQLELDPAASQKELAELLRQEPKWQPALLLQVKALLAGRQLKPAQQSLDELRSSAPENAEVWWLQGVIYRNQRKYPEAVKALEQAKKLGYSQAQIELELARMAVQQGQKPEARLRVLKVLQKQPELRLQLENDRLLKKLLKAGKGKRSVTS
ncbi:MAG: tetratricopeptide repeat protein [Candidatus Sericytochromatia bacterium]